MKVLITGATGMVGKGILLRCLAHPDIKEVHVLGRRETGVAHDKIKKITLDHFSDYTSILNELTKYDAAYLSMGVSAAGLDEATYYHRTFDYTVGLAKHLYELNPDMTIAYVSGQGTDSTETGRIMWSRVKGKTENALINMGFKQAFMYRPGAIIPLDGIK